MKVKISKKEKRFAREIIKMSKIIATEDIKKGSTAIIEINLGTMKGTAKKKNETTHNK